jgi:hypothetical protein
VFLNPRVYQAALRGTDATYVHEMAHLLTWRFQSHTLREGLADYLALQVHPGVGVGPNVDGYDWSSPIPTAVVAYLGTTRPPPQIPHTDSIAEFARFWDTHDLTDFEDELEEVREAVFERRVEAIVMIHFPTAEVEAVKCLAKAKGMGHTALIQE